MAYRRGAAAAALLAAVALAGCGQQGGSSPPPRAAAAFTDGDVDASVTLERAAPDEVRVTAVLTPRTRGFHLYSLALPEGGVDGLGVPTRLTVSAPLTATGPVTASAAPYGLRLPGLDVTLPVYPDGPVTLHLTAHVTAHLAGSGADAGADSGAGTGAISARVLLSYGACSSTAGCRPPVRAHPLVLPVPGA